MPAPVRLLLLALAAAGLTAAPVLVAVLRADEASPPATVRQEPASLADLDTTSLTVARASFCSRVATTEVEAALDGVVDSTRSYDSGDTTRLAPGVKDVAHEFGCGWTSAAGSTARAWIFAPPVEPDRAEALARSARGGDDCEATPDAAAYGGPTVALTCTGDDTVTASYRGLFGDAWLSCALDVSSSTDRDELRARADRWCAAVARAAASADPTG